MYLVAMLKSRRPQNGLVRKVQLSQRSENGEKCKTVRKVHLSHIFWEECIDKFYVIVFIKNKWNINWFFLIIGRPHQ
jgi:hypothetical protein